MALPNEIHPFNLLGNNANQYKVPYSLRFRASNSAYLNRPYDGGGYTGWFCYSFWVKRGSLGTTQTIHSGGNGVGSYGYFGFTSSDTFTFTDPASGTTMTLTTTQVFRDPSAWYHFFIQVDTTQATAANRVKIFVNGTQVTSFGTANYPNQNVGLAIAYIGTKSIGCLNYTGASPSNFFDGYIAEFYKFSGLTLSYTNFTTTDNITGQLLPAPYTLGAHASGGDWYLPFNTQYSNNLLFYFNGDNYGNTAYSVDGSATANGTMGSNTTIVAGRTTGNAFNFDGTINAYVDTGLATSYPSQFSISAWFKSTATPADACMIVSKSSYYATATTDFPFNVNINASGYVSATFDGGNDYNADMQLVSSTGGYNDGNWHHVVVTYKAANSVYLYIDATLKASNTSHGVTVSNNSRNWFIGRDATPNGGGSPGRPMLGQIDEVRLYSTQLTATDVTNLYNNGDALSKYGLGVDRSGYGTDFEPVNLSLVTDTSYDSMRDTPTSYDDGGNGRGNYPVLNPIDSGGANSLVWGNLYFLTQTGVGNMITKNSTLWATTGKWYFEVTVSNGSATSVMNTGAAGLMAYDPAVTSPTRGGGIGYGSNDFMWRYDGYKVTSGTATAYGTAVNGNNDVVMIAYDHEGGKIWFGKNGTWFASGSPASGTNASFDLGYPELRFKPSIQSIHGGGGTATNLVNFGQQPFVYTPPAGFRALNSYNLSNPSLPLV